MTIETMDQEQSPRPTAMERIEQVALVKGRERRERILARFDKLLGAPEAAVEAVKIVGETVDDLKSRAERRLTETAMDLAERADNAWARFTDRVTETKDKAIAKANELSDRAVNYGLTKLTSLEDKVVEACNVPAGWMEKAAVGAEQKAVKVEAKLDETKFAQATARANLSAEQAEIIMDVLRQMQAESAALEAKQAGVREKLQDKIDGARVRAVELNSKARDHRAGVESKRVVRNMFAKVFSI